MAITIKKISEMAGVSRSAVDKVLHNRPGISDEVRKRVLKIAEEHNYKPNKLARALKANDRNIKFAVIIPRPENMLFQRIQEGMEKSLEPFEVFGVKLKYFYTEGLDEEEMLSILHEISLLDFSGIAMRGMDTPAIHAEIDSFAARNIPVVTFDSDVSSSGRLCFIGEDHQKNGRMAATLLAKCLQEKGELAVVNGTNSIAGHRERALGFYKVVEEKYPKMKVVRHVEMLEQENLAYEMTCQLLVDFPELRGIFVAAGCAKQVNQAVEHLGRDVHMIAYNFVPEVASLVKKGRIDFAIGLAPFQEGEWVISTLFNAVYDHKNPTKTVLHTPTYICIADNIDAFF